MPALGSLLAQRHERRDTASFIEAAAGRPDGTSLGTSSGGTAPARHDARTARDSRLREDLDGADVSIVVGAVRPWCLQQLFGFAFLRSLTNRA